MLILREVRTLERYTILFKGYSKNKGTFRNVATAAFPKKLIFCFIKIQYGLYVLDRFDVLMSKMIFKK